MGLFDFSPEDVAGGTILQPGWYPLEITKVEDKVSKNGNAMTVIYLKCLEGISQSGETVQNVRVNPVNFVAAYPGFAVPFAKAVGVVFESGQKKSVPFNQESLGGKKILGYVKNEIYESRTQNVVADFKPFGS
jgi:hypothetical protein